MFDTPLKIAVLAGTVREQRESIQAARYVAEFGSHLPGVEIIFVDPKEFHFPGDGKNPEDRDARYSAITASVDAFFIVSPEYNHSFPGSLKRMLDSEYENYRHKPVALAGASNGNWGGVRAVEALVLTVRQMGLVAIAPSPYFPFVQHSFGDDGQPVPDQKERIDQNLQYVYNELIWMARVLKAGRDEMNS